MYQPGYLGIDESNHGNFPEIFVASYSDNPKDLEWRMKKFPKKRGGSKEKTLEKNEYKHIVMDRETKEYLGRDGAMLVIASELIRDFKGLEKVVIDGHIDGKLLSDLQILFPNGPVIDAYADGDRRFMAVNRADEIAYRLYKYYDSFKNAHDTKYYIGTNITPKYKRYREYEEFLKFINRYRVDKNRWDGSWEEGKHEELLPKLKFAA